jgi:plastocyanin
MSTDLQDAPAVEGPPPRDPRNSYLWDRVLFPLLIIVVSGLVIVTLVLNISRIFLSEPGNGAITLCSSIATVGFLSAIWASYQSRLPTSQSYAMLSGIGVLLIVSGWALIGAAEEHGEEEGPVAASAIEADSFNFGFDVTGEAMTNEEAPAIEVHLVSRQGSHTFVFEGFEDAMKLAADQQSDSVGRIELPPGTYTYYCDIVGHRQNGMEGQLEVTEAPPGTLLEGEGGPAGEGGAEAEAH